MVEISKEARGFKSGQNSPLRMHTAEYVQKAAAKVHEVFPRLSPNAVSTVGLAGVVLGGLVVENENRKAEKNKVTISAAVGLQTLGYLCDALDGALARAINEKTPGKVDTSRGATYDIFVDRVQEVSLAAMRSRSAEERGDRLGRIAADAAAITTTLPSIVRADKNRKGTSVDEVGNLPASLGSRPGRIVLNTIGELFPKAQPISDIVGGAANLYAVVHRWKSKEGEPLSEKEMKTAKNTEIILATVAVGAIAHTIYKAVKRKVR